MIGIHKKLIYIFPFHENTYILKLLKYSFDEIYADKTIIELQQWKLSMRQK